MKTIPMIFNQQMVKALMDGRKTVTRRPLKNQPVKNGAFWDFKWGAVSSFDYLPIVAGHATANAAPFKVGDLIWVRETFCFGRLDEADAEHPADRTLFIDQGCGNEYCIQKEWAVYKGVEELDEVKWKPSIHMPRKSSRLTLRVTDFRCERVQAITDEQASNEGVYPARPSSLLMPYYISFMDLWDELYGNWCKNPWVWVIEFEVIKKNVDEVAK
ncbi:MAG: hypothetical protein HRU18_08880 [Pseudoalteromonas sp.]|uniref:hypothetical protein n=1 Tax=Pseudoalteromonas sp. TaxID=53249 RepID=UPI001D9308FD|nr:hypothetical protein [Pseudoalteromonas sp.]NRA78312.1 hypothetical protein [Pseudoalteromonas sp.]